MGQPVVKTLTADARKQTPEPIAAFLECPVDVSVAVRMSDQLARPPVLGDHLSVGCVRDRHLHALTSICLWR